MESRKRLTEYMGKAQTKYKNAIREFALWKGKEPLDFLTEFDSIENAQKMLLWKRRIGSDVYDFYKFAMTDKYPQFIKDNAEKLDRARGICRIPTEPLGHNGSRAKSMEVISFFNHTCDAINMEQKIPKSTASIDSYVPKTMELKQLFRVGNVKERAIIVCGKWGLRVNDFAALKREPILEALHKVDNGIEQLPVSFKVLTTKEKVPAVLWIDGEVKEALELYFKTTTSSEWLFLKNGDPAVHITEDQLNYMLKNLYDRAYHTCPDGLIWHSLRKWLIGTMANVGISVMHIKMFTGKQVQIDMDTYQKELADLRTDFLKLLPAITLGDYIQTSRQDAQIMLGNYDALVEIARQMAKIIREKVDPNFTVSIPVAEKRKTPLTDEELKDLMNGDSHD